MSKNQRKEIVINSILSMKKATPSQITSITKKGLASYFQSSKTFGKKSGVTREALTTIREMFRIRKVESRILDYILENIDNMDLSSVETAVMVVERRDSVIVTSVEAQPEMGGCFERREIISDFTE